MSAFAVHEKKPKKLPNLKQISNVSCLVSLERVFYADQYTKTPRKGILEVKSSRDFTQTISFKRFIPFCQSIAQYTNRYVKDNFLNPLISRNMLPVDYKNLT